MWRRGHAYGEGLALMGNAIQQWLPGHRWDDSGRSKGAAQADVVSGLSLQLQFRQIDVSKKLTQLRAMPA